jgi:hypothetical protein
LRKPTPPPPAKSRALIPLYYSCARDTLTYSLSPSQLAMLGHLEALRDTVVTGRSASEQIESAILLIDLYEAILESNDILVFRDQKKVTEH